MISNINPKGDDVKKIDDFNAADRISVTLLENNVFFLTGEIDEDNVNECIRWIVYENLDQRVEKTLTIYINSTGGDLYQALGLIDIMRTSTHPIRTIGVGTVMSAAFLIFASGTPGERYIAPNTGVMCHQFSESTEGKYHDIKAAVKESDSLNTRMLEILKEATGLPAARVKSKLLPASDVYMTAQEAIDLNIADQLLL